MRSKRDVSAEIAESESDREDDNQLENVAKVDLEQIIEKEIEEVQMAGDEVDKRDAAADASRLSSAHVLPPPHDVPPHAGLPLFPPLGTAPPHAGPTPVPSSGHHVTISTPTHHVSHGVADHGTHHAVHKEHHQVHGHGHHITPVVQHHHMIDHHPAPHHPAPHHPHPAPHHPVPHHPHHHPHQVAAVPIVMVPPTAHASHQYDHPVSGYPKPAHGGSLEEIFGLLKPAYHAPEPAYYAPEPAYHPPEPAYHAPEPAYHAPEPAYHAPEPAYHKPEPAYHAPEPAYHAKPSYKPDYKHPTGDYVSPHAQMAGHPFSLEAVFNLDMPLFYMKKYPHMAHMMHHGHHVEHHAPVYHPPAYKNPASGYAKPAHGASLEEIFGVHTAYHPSVPVTVHKPDYHPPKPAYHAPKPAYHAPEPAYHAPEPAYHAPEPAYHVPEPAYHAPEPAYHAPEPTYHAPEPAYHVPEPAYHAPKPEYHVSMPGYHPKPKYGHGSLEAIFGVGPAGHHPAPHYDVPTTYKPKMPDYLHGHPHAKSLPPAHDPGYVLHYLPYDDYQPVHPETLAHPAPVPHHPHAAHMLVPGTHVPPGPHHLPMIPHGFVTPVPHHAPHHTPLLGVTPVPHHPAPLLGVTPLPHHPAPHTPLLGVTPAPLQGVSPSPAVPLLGVTPHDATPILHPHSVLETVPAHPAVPFPELSFLPHAGVRKKRSPEESGQSSFTLSSSHITNDTLNTFSFDLDNTSTLSDFDHLDSAEQKLLGTLNTSEVKLIHLCDHKNHGNRSSWEPCHITGGKLSDIESLFNINTNLDTDQTTKNKFKPIDTNNLPLLKSDLLEKVTKSKSLTTNKSAKSKVFHTSQFDQWIEETTTPLPTTPGSISSTQSWLFPDEGTKKKPRGFFIDHTSSVYFDPSLRKDSIKV